EHGLRPRGLDSGRVVGARDRCDQRDSVSLGNRLAEASPPVHRHRFFTIPSPTRAEFVVTLAAGRRPGTPRGSAAEDTAGSDANRVPDGLELQKSCDLPGALGVGGAAEDPPDVLRPGTLAPPRHTL